MTTLFFFMLYNFRAGSVRVQQSGVHIKKRERERSQSTQAGLYLPDKSFLVFDPLPTRLSVVFLFFGKQTVMFS